MNTIIKVKDKTFKPLLSAREIALAVDRVAQQVNHDLAGRDPLFLPILNGSFMFAADLMKRVNIPSELSFVKYTSYSGCSSQGHLKSLIGIDKSVKDRTVVILEDIVDTGTTIKELTQLLRDSGAKEVKVATFCSKPSARKVEVAVDYVGVEIENRFIVGYGLDYDGYGRNLPEIYVWSEENEE